MDNRFTASSMLVAFAFLTGVLLSGIGAGCGAITDEKLRLAEALPGQPSPLLRKVHDPLPAVSGPEVVPANRTWDETLAQVDFSPALQAFRERAVREQGFVIQGSYLPNPVLTLETEMMPLDDLGFGQARNKVMLSQRIETAGKRRSRVDLAVAEKETAEAQYFLKRAQIQADAFRLFIQACFARIKAETAQRRAELKTRSWSLARNLHAEGRISESDLVAEEAAAAEARSLQGKFAAEERKALRGLEGLLGLPPGTVLSCLGARDRSEAIPKTEDARERILAQNPELIVGDRRVLAARARVEAEESLAWPDLTLGLGYMRGAEGGPARDDFAGAFIQAPLPLWDRNQGGRLSAEAEVREAEAALLADAHRVLDAWQGLDEERAITLDRILLYREKILPLLEKEISLARARVNAGRDPKQRLLEAELSLETARLSLLELEESKAQLEAAMKLLLGL